MYNEKDFGGSILLFMVAAPVLWNNLPFPLREAKNIDSSKHLLKTYLFSQAF